MSSDRDNRGRFAKGNRASPGRPPRLAEQRFMEAIHNAVTPEQIGRAVAVLAAQADQGDIRACTALLKLAFGDLSLLSLLEREAARGTGARASQPDAKIATALVLDVHWRGLLKAELAKIESFDSEGVSGEQKEEPAESAESAESADGR